MIHAKPSNVIRTVFNAYSNQGIHSPEQVAWAALCTLFIQTGGLTPYARYKRGTAAKAFYLEYGDWVHSVDTSVGDLLERYETEGGTS